jgi:hypothetical protein
VCLSLGGKGLSENVCQSGETWVLVSTHKPGLLNVLWENPFAFTLFSYTLSLLLCNNFSFCLILKYINKIIILFSCVPLPAVFAVTGSSFIVTCTVIQGNQKVSVHLMITVQKVTSNVQSVLRQSPDRQGQGDTRLTLTPSVIPNSSYVIMVRDWNCLKYFCAFLYSNHQVYRDFLITLYKQKSIDS